MRGPVSGKLRRDAQPACEPPHVPGRRRRRGRRPAAPEARVQPPPPAPAGRDVAFAQGVASGQPATSGITLWSEARRAHARRPAAGGDLARRGLPPRHLPQVRHGGGRQRLHGPPSRRAQGAQARRALLLPLRLLHGRRPRRPLPDRAAGRLPRARADRVLLLPGLRVGLLHAHAALAKEARPRLRDLPRRLHLREALRRRRGAQGLDRRQRRRRGPDAAGVPRQVRALPLRRQPPRGPRRPSDARDLGRPRGRGQLGARPARAAPPTTRACRSSSAAPAGFKAFFEHHPRLRRRGDRDRIYGAQRFGANAEVFLLDQRSYRDDQPCGDQLFAPCADGIRARPHAARRRPEGVAGARARRLARRRGRSSATR